MDMVPITMGIAKSQTGGSTARERDELALARFFDTNGTGKDEMATRS